MIPLGLDRKKIQSALDEHLRTETDMLNFLSFLVQSENDIIIDKDEIREMISRIESLRTRTDNLFGRNNRGKNSKNGNNDNKTLKDENLDTDDGKIKLILEKNRDIPDYLLKSFKNARDSLHSFYDSLDRDDKNSIKIINLSPQISLINNFSKYLGENPPISLLKKMDPLRCILYSSDKVDKYNITFENGDKIILSPDMPNINTLSYKESLELLRFLEVVIKDDKYDYIRRKLMEHIAALKKREEIKRKEEAKRKEDELKIRQEMGDMD